MKELRRRLERIDVPGEHEARRRAWRVVAAAYAGREPTPRSSRRLRPLLAAAAAVALLAAAASPPVRAVLGAVRDAVAGVEDAEPALFALPAQGSLLVTSDSGSWIVQPDGSKRLLAGYADASWSPFGRFVVAVRRDELAALEPDGRVRWSLARPGVRQPRWGGTATDTRIAYLSGGDLRVVAGDGTGDRLLAGDVAAVAPAWRPRGGHLLAFVQDEQVVVADSDGGRRLWAYRAPGARALEWSVDGELLLVRGERSLIVLDAGGRLRNDLLRPDAAAPLTAAAFAPDGRSLAFVQSAQGRSDLWVVPRLRPDASAARRLFSGPGTFTGIAWSPDGRWLLVAWRDADQWLFLDPAGARRIEAVGEISRQFGVFPQLAGWVRR